MKLALITGASSGLGLALCHLLQKQGYSLLVTGRKNLPSAFDSVTADLSKDRRPVIDLIEKHAPDLVINNAGFTYYGPALSHSMDLFEVNANAAIEITLAAARTLLKHRKQGTILNVSSAAGELSMPYMALYSAAKAALTSFSKSFDAEMRGQGIRTLVSLPGQIDTDFASKASHHQYKQQRGLKKEYVAQCIWRQIQKGKTIQIIDWKYKLGLLFAHLFPCLAEKLVSRNIKKRFLRDNTNTLTKKLDIEP